MSTSNYYFLQTIGHLLQNEEAILYNRLIPISDEECKLVADLLRKQYEKECLEYPYAAPVFDEGAALWAAKTLYVAAQLLLYRETKQDEVPALFPADDNAITPSTILSVDLSLRFLPLLLLNAKAIDDEDVLVNLLEGVLNKWHYSAIAYGLPAETWDFKEILSDNCVKQLYANRIIEHKVRTLAEHTAISEYVKGSMGNYVGYFWSDL